MGRSPAAAGAAGAWGDGSFPSGPGPRLAFSGWLASGKDTVAAEVYARLGVPCRPASMAHAIKSEVTDLARLAAAWHDEDAALAAIVSSTGTDRAHAAAVLALLTGQRPFEEARVALAATSGWDRTGAVRAALQYWGTDVRRSMEPSYWVDRAVEFALASLDDGVVAYFTDVRFPDEAEGLRAIGYRVVRVRVTRETQRRRLAARDGIDPARTALEHPSETALDGYDGFDLVVDNDGDLAGTVARILDDLA